MREWKKLRVMLVRMGQASRARGVLVETTKEKWEIRRCVPKLSNPAGHFVVGFAPIDGAGVWHNRRLKPFHFEYN